MRAISVSTVLIVLFALVSGCSTPPKKVDIREIPMPEVRQEERAPGSLWSGENTRNRLFTDFRARYVGDIVTILITEKTEAKKEASTSTSRTSSEDASVTDLFGLPLDLNTKIMGNAFSPTASGEHTNSFDGTGSTERKGEITTTISARVVKVLSNGNLFIEGKKETSVNHERQYVIISGIVRPEDISSSNTITSDAIADLRIELSGYGVIDDKQKPGWLTRALDKVWPF